jgi:hypothetical protein
MSSVMKSVTYSYIEGYPTPYALDAVKVENGEVTLNIHEKFESLEDFYSGVQEVIHDLTLRPKDMESLKKEEV